MEIEIDQSGKIEDTSRNTVLAYISSDEKTKSVLISARNKRKVQELFRRFGLRRLYVYKLFALGIYFLIKDLRSWTQVIIDAEYTGKENIIKEILEELLGKKKINIDFKRIGNHSRVHYVAWNVFAGKREPDLVLNYRQIVAKLKMTDGRLNGCFTTRIGARPRSLETHYNRRKKKNK